MVHHILMYNKIITSFYPHPRSIKVLVERKRKMVPKIHEVVYFQKIRPFINLWSLMCSIRRKRILKLFLTHSHTHTHICTNYFTSQKLWTVVYCTLPWHAKQFIFSWLQQNTQTDDRAGWRALNSSPNLRLQLCKISNAGLNIDNVLGNDFFDA